MPFKVMMLTYDVCVDQVQKQELSRQVQFEQEKASALRADCERLQASMLDTKDRIHDVEARRDAEKVAQKHRQRDTDRDREKERHRQVRYMTGIYSQGEGRLTWEKEINREKRDLLGQGKLTERGD